jgi:hypothetical protein
MKFHEAFPSKYLKAADLEGKEHTVTIDHIASEVMRNGEAKHVAYFRGKKKGLVLNVTNGKRLMARYGDELDDWAGGEVILYVDVTDMNGQIVDCIRLKTKPVGKPERKRMSFDEPPPPDDTDNPGGADDQEESVF